MLSTVRTVVRNGKIELLEPVALIEGVQLLITILTDEDQLFWQQASTTTLAHIWDHDEDDVYAKLLTP